MLTALRLGNFKAFAETQRMPIRPLSLIFGANSAGKSSLIHGLILAHEANRTGRLEGFSTELGGDAVDLGGFRQYVHRREVGRRVEWAMEIDTAGLKERIAELFAPVQCAGVSLTWGMELNDKGEPLPDVVPHVMSYEIEADRVSLLRMSWRREGHFRLDRLEHEHPVLQEVIKAIIQSTTTTETLTSADFEDLNEAINALVPDIVFQIGNFFPKGLLKTEKPFEFREQQALFPVSRGNRKEDLAAAIRFVLPRILDELVQGINETVVGELGRIRYLGPLRSYPSRHHVFEQNPDSNWVAGGGFAWDAVRLVEKIRNAVNSWLAQDRLQTPYELVVRELVGIDQLEAPLLEGLEETVSEGLDYELDYDVVDGRSTPTGSHPIIKDPDAEVAQIQNLIRSADIDRLQELILIDRRTNTVVSHRDVGIGISQVLPVLVSAYGFDKKILAIEQPEIHLHPKLQAELGDVFIESALGERQNTFIIETHSEHLILRLLRRIRETAEGKFKDGVIPITPEDVCILYAKVSPKGGTTLTEIPVTPEGEFETSWPDGFFAERALELL